MRYEWEVRKTGIHWKNILARWVAVLRYLKMKCTHHIRRLSRPSKEINQPNWLEARIDLLRLARDIKTWCPKPRSAFICRVHSRKTLQSEQWATFCIWSLISVPTSTMVLWNRSGRQGLTAPDPRHEETNYHGDDQCIYWSIVAWWHTIER